MNVKPDTRIRTFTIVTPCLNSEALIRQTVESILRQTAVRNGRVALEYIVCDGGSRDGTLGIVRSLCGNDAKVLSEPDRGMYDALAKGLRLATGDVVAYLNAGDMYHQSAFDVVTDVLEDSSASWVTGLAVHYNERGQLAGARLPFRFRKHFIRRGLYGTYLPTLQQESTFWRRELMRGIDLERLAALKFAGDHYLWTRFALVDEPAIIESFLGGFLVHPGQKSEEWARYRAEFDSLSERPRPADYLLATFDKMLWRAPGRVKKAFNRRRMYRWHSGHRAWC